MTTRIRRRFNVGDRIGGWTLIEYPFASDKVLVRCDCGFEAWRWRSNFSSGSSMGCRECMKSTPTEKTYKSVQQTAKRRGIEWNLSLDEWIVFAQSECYYCGSPPSNMIASYGYLYNGVDRIDSGGVYEAGNCVTACKLCNRAKSDQSQQDFLDWINRVHDKSTSLS